MDRSSNPKWFRSLVPYDVCFGLHAWAQAEYELDPGSLLGAMRGLSWASRKREARHAKPGLEDLVRILNRAVPETEGLRWDAWAVMLWDGGLIDWHDHHQAEIATVTYLQMPPGSGAIRFEAGRAVPGAGDMLAFGGGVRHSVEAGTGIGAGPRISVACNFYRGLLIG